MEGQQTTPFPLHTLHLPKKSCKHYQTAGRNQPLGEVNHLEAWLVTQWRRGGNCGCWNKAAVRWEVMGWNSWREERKIWAVVKEKQSGDAVGWSLASQQQERQLRWKENMVYGLTPPCQPGALLEDWPQSLTWNLCDSNFRGGSQTRRLSSGHLKGFFAVRSHEPRKVPSENVLWGFQTYYP